jgi:hypothetical protein
VSSPITACSPDPRTVAVPNGYRTLAGEGAAARRSGGKSTELLAFRVVALSAAVAGLGHSSPPRSCVGQLARERNEIVAYRTSLAYVFGL